MPLIIGHTLDTQALIHRSAKNEMGGVQALKMYTKL